MQLDSIRNQIREYIINDILFHSAEIEGDTSLLGEGILDSTGGLEMVLFLESHFGIDVEEDDVVPDNFDSLNALSAFVERKQRSMPERR
ncbi:MAG: acyl carrier protein [Chloroflexota bacterium]|nr:acyl carrier protein [Chloroflexota bacterium]